METPTPMYPVEDVAIFMQLETMRLVLVSIVCLAIAEYIVCLPREIRYMWKQGPWTSVRVLFFLVRYTIFIDVPLNIPFNLAVGLGSRGCTPIIWIMSVVNVIGTGVSEAIIFKRAYALSRQSKVVGIILTAHWVLAQIAGITLSVVFARSVGFLPAMPELHSLYNRCTIIQGNTEYIGGINIITMISQIVATGVSFFYVSANFKLSTGHLIGAIYKDGVIYFIVMSVALIASAVASFVAPITWRFVGPLGSRTLYASLAVRMVLNLREAGERGTELDNTQHSRRAPSTLALHFARVPRRPAPEAGKDSNWLYTSTCVPENPINVAVTRTTDSRWDERA